MVPPGAGAARNFQEGSFSACAGLVKEWITAFFPATRPVPAYADRPRVVPSTVLAAFESCDDVNSARAYTRQLAHSHYENFTVVSVLLPRHLRQDFCNIYAFCRTADDLADEVKDKARASEYLSRFRQQTEACYQGMSRHANLLGASGNHPPA